MAGIQFLSKILGLTGLIIRKNSSNRQVLLDIDSRQTTGTSIDVYLPYKTGTILLSPSTAGTNGQVLITNGDGTTEWASLSTAMIQKAGVVSSGSFYRPSPNADYEYSVVFNTAYPNTNYAVLIVGINQRNWSYTTKTTTGFVIKTNSGTALNGEVSWFTSQTGS
jgi:hypothetical protein